MTAITVNAIGEGLMRHSAAIVCLSTHDLPSEDIHSVWALKRSDGASLYANPPDGVRCHNPTLSSRTHVLTVRLANSTESVTPLQHTTKAKATMQRVRLVHASAPQNGNNARKQHARTRRGPQPGGMWRV